MDCVTRLPNTVDVPTVARLLNDRTPITLIDVRTPAEFASAHIPGSYNIPLDQLPEHRDELRDRLHAPAVLVCRSGTRARQAEQVLRQADVPQVHVLDGGIMAWEAAGESVTRGTSRWSLERQVRGVAGALVLVGMMGGLVWQPLRLVAAFIGAGLTFSAVTDSCVMGMLLSKLPYNQQATSDVQSVLAQLTTQTSDQHSS